MEKHTDRAGELFAKGYNCAQSALCAFIDEIGLDEKTALQITSSFGGGMGGMQEVCGALTGSFMACGLCHGYHDIPEPEAKRRHNQRIQELANKFREQFGDIRCGALLKRIQEDESAKSKGRPCMKYVLAAVENFAQTL